MAKTFIWRFGSEGLRELARDMEALGPTGVKALELVKGASPQLADAMERARKRVGETRTELEGLGKSGAKAVQDFADYGSARLEDFASRAGVAGTALRNFGPAGLVGAAGIGLVVAGVNQSITAFAQAQQEQARFNALLRATGNTTGMAKSQLEELAGSVSRAFAIDDEGVLRAIGTLATFGSVSGAAFEKTVRAAAELSAAFGEDLGSSVSKLGDAAERLATGSVEGLAKKFPFLRGEIESTVRKLAEGGDGAAAFNALLDGMIGKIGGSGEAQRDTLIGSLNALRVSWENLLETFGERSGGADPISLFFLGWTTIFNQLNEALDNTSDKALDLQLGEALGNMNRAGVNMSLAQQEGNPVAAANWKAQWESAIAEVQRLQGLMHQRENQVLAENSAAQMAASRQQVANAGRVIEAASDTLQEEITKNHNAAMKAAASLLTTIDGAAGAALNTAIRETLHVRA